MQVSVLQDKLVKGLSSVSYAVSSKPSLPILSNVLLTAKEGILQLAATDLSLGIQLRIGAKVKKEGTITVPAKVFTELVSSFPLAPVELSSEGESLRIQCGSYRARLSGIPATEFPSLNQASGTGEFSLSTNSFRDAVARVAFAASSDETRPVLSGVLLRLEGSGLQLVATDGYRLSVVQLASDSEKKGEKWQKALKRVVGEGLIVPARALRDVDRLADELGASEVSVGLVAEQNLLLFRLGDGEVTTRLIEGSFPNFSQVIPKEEKIVANIDRESLLRAVRAAAIFARDSANIIQWKLNKSGLTISANAPSYGEGENMVEISLSGGEGEIAFNSRYLLELLAIFPTERIVFGMNGGLDPGVFRPASEKETFFHLIMPVRVQK